VAVSKDFIEYVQELFAPFGPVRVKRMFGAAGVYLDDLFFAVIADDALYLKVDEENKPRFVERGSTPFLYPMPDGRQVEMSYWRAPDEALESADEAEPWVRLALDAARRSKAKKPGQRRKSDR